MGFSAKPLSTYGCIFKVKLAGFYLEALLCTRILHNAFLLKKITPNLTIENIKQVIRPSNERNNGMY